MSFDIPRVLWLLPAVPFLAVLVYVRARRGVQAMIRLTGSSGREGTIGPYVVHRFFSDLLFLLAIGVGIVGLSGPGWGETSIEDERQGLEIAFVIDVSNSMMAEDISPSRLERSREVARSIATGVPESLYSIIAFKGDGTVIVPMTEDVNAFDVALDYLGPGFVSAPGTNLAAGLDRAINAFPEGSPRVPVIVVFSDGQQQDGALGPVIARLRDSDITVISVVAGTETPVTIPVASGGVLRDAEGQPVLVGVNTSSLQELAQATRGEMVYLNDPTAVQFVSNTLGELGGGPGPRFRTETISRYRLFLVAMLVLLAVRALVDSRPEERKR